MIIRILGCHGSESAIEMGQGRVHECKTCGFLINGTCMMDAGTVCGSLREGEQAKIRNVLLSHAHLDHIKGLPQLADNMAGRTPHGPINIWGLSEVLGNLRRHVFNDVIYPDFTRIPTAAEAPLAFQPLVEEKPVHWDGLEVTAVRVDHIVPATGFIVRDAEAAILYSGDTGETRRIWEIGALQRGLKAAFIETSFPNDLRELARVSGHLTPELLAGEVAKLGRPDIPLYIYHLKPAYRDRIASELKQLNLPNLSVVEEDQVIVV